MKCTAFAFAITGLLAASVTFSAEGAPPAGGPPGMGAGKTYEERIANLMKTFRESPAEEAARQVVLKRFRFEMEGRQLEAMKLLSPEFTEHMTPNRMPKDGKSAYQRFMERAQRVGDKGQPNKAALEYPFQARASEDLVTLFHSIGCDIFRVRNGLVTDHWDCTPWEPFSNKGERAQLEDMAKQQR